MRNLLKKIRNRRKKSNEKEKLYKYVSVYYDDDYLERLYSYKTNIEDIKVGDTVLVDRNGDETTGVVSSINYYKEGDVPYPLDKTKDIIEVVGYEDDYDEYEDDIPINVKIEKVLERDIDLLMINKFINTYYLLDYFLKKVDKYEYKLIDIEHSFKDNELGESDITLIAEKDDSKLGILIENKIDAIAMDLQPERYVKRGEKGVKDKKYDEYVIFIIAPQKYLDTNVNAKKYPNCISYEELATVMKGDQYAFALLNKAIEEKENGYTVIEDEMVTKFWHRYYDFIKENYPKIKINEIEGPRGARAVWPELFTNNPKVKIMHKSDRGFMDLTFSNMGEHIDIFNKYVSEDIINKYEIVRTGKSLSIRINVPVLDFKNEFDNYIEEMHECMKSALELYDILKSINVLKMYSEI